MEDWENKIGRLLQDESAMEQIMALAHSLNGEKQGEEKGETAEDASSGPDLSAAAGLLKQLSGGAQGGDLGALLGQIDPKMLEIGTKVLGEWNRGDDQRAALFEALKPFVKEKRHARIDKAIQAARMTQVIRAALNAFRETQGEEEA